MSVDCRESRARPPTGGQGGDASGGIHRTGLPRAGPTDVSRFLQLLATKTAPKGVLEKGSKRRTALGDDTVDLSGDRDPLDPWVAAIVRVGWWGRPLIDGRLVCGTDWGVATWAAVWR